MSLSNKVRGLKAIWKFDNRFWLAFTKIFFPSETLQTYRYKGIEFIIDHSGGDANGAREVLASPMYKRFLPKMNLDRPVNVLDLGANNGGFSLLLAANGVMIKKIVSVEFNPQTYIRLHFNLFRNVDSEVVPLNAALCGKTRTVKTVLGAGSVSDSIYKSSGGAERRRYSVRGITLNELIDDHFADEVVDICKIDVEGAEFEVFLEPNHSSIARCRYLIMEIHERDGRRADEIIPIIEGLGLKREPTEPEADPTVHFFVNERLV